MRVPFAVPRQLSPRTTASSLGAVRGLGAVTGNELLNMLDWLLKRQPWIERGLARRYLRVGTLCSEFANGPIGKRDRSGPVRPLAPVSSVSRNNYFALPERRSNW